MRGKTTGGAFFLAAFIVGIGAGAATAGSAFSSNLYFSAGSNDFYNNAGIFTTPSGNHKVWADIYTASRSGNLPSGWIGGSAARVRASDGAVRCETAYHYSSGSYAGWTVTGCTANYKSTYYSQGRSRAWTGSSYRTVYSIKSPNQNS